jgi:hypothetical protein
MSTWQNWVNFIVGLWIILSGYLNFGPEANTTNLTIAGIVVAALALWSIVDSRSTYRMGDRRHSHA